MLTSSRVRKRATDVGAIAADGASRALAPVTRRKQGAALRQERLVLLAITFVPFAGFCLAIVDLARRGIGTVDVAIFAVMYLVTGFGITVGFHRLFAHRSFEAVTGARIALAIAGSMAIQGPVLRWVADHRRHHAFSDRSADPHSPGRSRRSGFVARASGLWHAQVGWFFDAESTVVGRFAPDLLADPWVAAIDRRYPLWMLASLGLPAIVGGVATRSWEGASTAVVWGGLCRIFVVQQVTWLINSVCHTFGRRPFVTRDLSTNHWLLAILALGEGWHNNHHAFPGSARQGVEPWQVDPSWLVIRCLGALGLAREIRLPTRRQIDAARVSASTPSEGGAGRVR